MSDDWLANQALIDRLEDLRRGLHAAMTALLTNNDKTETEKILRQMDHHLGVTIDHTKVPRRG